MAVEWIDDEDRDDPGWADAGAAEAPPSSPQKVDGRVARSQRTFAAVVDAFLDLLEEGDLRPTAARVADRAGVSRRSVYVHFRDLDTLFAAAAQRHFELRLVPLLSYEPLPGPLQERIAAFVDLKAARMERVTPVRRAAMVHEPFSREVAAQLRTARDRAAAEIEHVFAPELDALPGDRRDMVAAALVVAGTWPAWDTLRRGRGLSVDAAKGVLSHLLGSLLA
jgi:TetR/AcrR family transcriptional regulator, regulator of autoinduction and epiphytic fitness